MVSKRGERRYASEQGGVQKGVEGAVGASKHLLYPLIETRQQSRDVECRNSANLPQTPVCDKTEECSCQPPSSSVKVSTGSEQHILHRTDYFFRRSWRRSLLSLQATGSDREQCNRARHRFCLPPDPGGMRMPIPAAPAARDLLSSMRPFARLMPGTTQSPQLHCMPCQAYLPTLVRHLGHSRRPSSLPCSSWGRIQESGSRK